MKDDRAQRLEGVGVTPDSKSGPDRRGGFLLPPRFDPFLRRARAWPVDVLGASAVNYATTVRLRAERRLAEIVDEGQATGEIATAERGRPVSVQDSDTSSPATLPDIGVSRQRLQEARAVRDAFTDEELVEKAAEATAPPTWRADPSENPDPPAA